MMSQQTPKKAKKRNWHIKTILKYTLILMVLGFFLIAGASLGLLAALVKDDPVRSIEEIQDTVFKNNLTGFAYFSNKNESNNYELIGMLRADEDRRPVQFNEIPKYVYNAVLAIEDRDFENHFGINIKGLSRAILQQALRSDVQTGGSTITQQLAKISFFSFEKTFERKAKEMFLALRIDRNLSKNAIFTAYINKINFGKAANLNNVYGIQAAAKGYFNKDAQDLNLAEAAYLAGIPQRPYAYSAFDSNGFVEEKFNLAKDRQELVLARMLEEEFITNEEYQEALAFDIKAAFDTSQKRAYNKYPYLMLEIENRAAEKLLESMTDISTDSSDYAEALEAAKQELLTGGYRVITTIDKSIYEAMNEVAANSTHFREPIDYNFKYPNGETIEVKDALEEVGATLIDNETGAILGFVGGRDFYTSQVNHSNFRGGTKRQSGSSIKPVLEYGPAVEMGAIQPAIPIDDIPLGDQWEPENWNHKYNGLLTARKALNMSYNIPAVKVFKMVGQESAYEYFTKLGYNVDKTFFMQAGNTPAIGSIETSPEEMTRAFTTFANGGTYIGAHMIERIVDNDGDVVYEYQPEAKIVFSEQTSFIITDMLRTVITNGTGGTVLGYIKDRDIAGKTGTTNDSKDLWFVGYTPKVSLGVWVGYELPYPIKDGALASRIWGEMMKEVLETKPEISPKEAKFEVPGGLVKMEVSSTSGKLPSELTKEAGYLVTDWFNKKYIPTEIDESLERARVVFYNGEIFLAKAETPEDMVENGIFFKREPYELPYETDRNGQIKKDAEGNPIKKARPVDYDKELPVKEDPRVSDGLMPVPPTNFIFKPMGYKNIISFDKTLHDNIVGYRVYRASTSSFGFERAGKVLQKDLKPERLYFEDPVNSSIPYVYYITAVDVVGLESSPSELIGNVEIAPFDPTQLDPNDEDPAADPQNDGNDNNDGNTNGDSGNSDNGSDSDSDSGANGDQNSGDTTVSLPTKPANLTGSASGLQVTLTWDLNPEDEKVEKYNVYYSRKSDGEFNLLGSSDENRFSYTLAIIGDAYYYISAVNEEGESEPSKIIHIVNN